MHAEEAKQIAEEVHNRQPQTDHLLHHVYTRIRDAAAKGLRELVDPLHGLRTPISFAQRTAVYSELGRKGYRVVKRPNYYNEDLAYVVSW
jgi:hypothetical protein